LEEAFKMLHSIFRVWKRYYDVFRKNLVYGVVTTFVEPLLYLFAFGYGLGSLIPTLDYMGVTLEYRAFIFAGIVGQTALFIAFFEGAYGGFIRMYYQRVFQAIAVTPVTLTEVLWAEILWDATRATFGIFAVLLIGSIVGDFSISGAIAYLPIAFLSSMLFASLGVFVASKAKTIEEIGYPQYLFIFPMFLFCGVFFPIERLPETVGFVVKLLPLTGVAVTARSFLLKTPVDWLSVSASIVWLVVFVPLSISSMKKRLVK